MALDSRRARRDLPYTPRHLAERILTQRRALEGERKQVSVLFADIKSSVELAGGVDAEEWHRILDRFFEILANGVHRFEGTINQYTGDGIMALFGAPLAHEDHAQRACGAALHLQRELRSYAQQLRREQALDFRVRMGVHSGEVVVGRIGDDLRMDYTAQGQTVGLASRLEALAESGRVYISQHTAGLVSGFFALEDLGEFKLKGLPEPVRAYALVGEGALRTRLERARARGFSSFVGRERELAALERTLEKVTGSGGRVLAVAGEPGLGKSRLSYEFAELCKVRGTPISVGNGVSHGRSLPFFPILQLLRDALELSQDEDDLHARRKIAGTLLLADPDAGEDLPLLFDFLGVGDPAQPLPLLEGEGKQRRVFAILRRFLTRSAGAPSVILLEDLHWFDAASLAFLSELSDEIGETRTLLIVNFRPPFEAPWLRSAHCEELLLRPLDDAAVDALLSDWIGSDPELAELASSIREQARGNPFFVEEVVQSLVERGTLAGERGGYRLARPVREIAIPHTVQALIASRLDRLDEEHKALLEAAAVIGKQFRESVLRRVSVLGDEEFPRALAALLDAELLLEETLYPERGLAFKHPLTQEVAYGSQLGDRRGRLHGAVARALEELDDGSLDESAAVIAHHWEQAGNRLASARWVHRAARWIGPSNPPEAMALWRKLVGLAGEAPRTPEISFLVARACRWLLFLAGSQGMAEGEALELLRLGREHSEGTRDRRSLALTLANYAYYQAQIAVSPAGAVELLERARAIADDEKQPALQLLIGIRLAQALGFAGRFPEVVSLGRELLARLEEPGLPEVDPIEQVTLYATVGDSLDELGQPREGIALIERGLLLASRRDLALNAGYCHNAYVRLAALTGEVGKAEHHARAAMRAAERTGNKAMRVYAHDVLGLAHQLNRRWREAVREGERAIALSQSEGVARISENAQRAHLSYSYLRAGQLEPARLMAEAAVAASERCGPRYTPRAHLALARVLLALEGARGERRIAEQLDLAQSAVDVSDARIYEPVILEDRARLARVSQKPQERLRLLRLARARYQTMGLEIPARRISRALEGSAIR